MKFTGRAPLVKYPGFIAMMAILTWPALVYYSFYKPFTYYPPPSIIATQLGVVIVALQILYGLSWYLAKKDKRSFITSLSDLPGLLISVLTAIIAASFIVSALNGNQREYLSSNAQEIIALFAIVFAAFSLGDVFFSSLKLGASAIERIFFSLIAGLGIIAQLMFLAGMAGVIYLIPLRILTYVLAVFGITRATKLLMPFFYGSERIKLLRLPSPISLSFATFLGLSLLAAWIPTWNYDSLLYHIAVPKFYLEANKIFYIRDFLPANYPLNGEMLFMLGLIIKNETVPQLLSYFISALLVLGVFAYTKRFFSHRAAVVAAMLLLSVSSFTSQFPINNNDSILALFTLSGVYALSAWQKEVNDRWILIGGLMFGLAAGSKYSGFFLLASAGILVAILIAVSAIKGYRKTIESLGILGTFAAAALIGVGPWLLKNYLFTGNPTYPMFISIFGGRDWAATSTDIFRDTVRNACLAPRGYLGYLSLPWYLTIREPTEMSIGPSFLSLLPFAFNRNSFFKAPVIVAVLVALGFLIPWAMLLAQVARFALPGIILFVVAIAAGIDASIGNRRFLEFVTLLIIMVGLLTNTFLLVSDQFNALSIGIGQRSHKQFMDNNMLYKFSEQVNSQIPRNKKIAMIIDNRAFYIDGRIEARKILMLSPLNNSRIDQININSPDDLMRIFKNEDVDYVFATDEVRRYTYRLPENSPYGIYRPIMENLDRLIDQGRLKGKIRVDCFWLYEISQ